MAQRFFLLEYASKLRGEEFDGFEQVVSDIIGCILEDLGSGRMVSGIGEPYKFLQEFIYMVDLVNISLFDKFNLNH